MDNLERSGYNGSRMKLNEKNGGLSMSAISRWLDRFCYRHPNFGIENLMKYIALGNVVVFLLDMVSKGTFSQIIAFYPSLILRGQIWRLITFVFVPLNSGLIWFVFSVMLYYSLGNALERQWGTARFSMFYLLGVVLNVITGFVLYFALGGPVMQTANMYYVNMSMFLAFATLYPDMGMLFMGIIPIKIKWLAFLDVALFAIDVFGYLSRGQFLFALLPIVGILNYLIFFWDSLMDTLGRSKRRVSHRVDPKTVNFKKAAKEVKKQKGYLHKCAVCGVTDADNPNMEFRYCSKCNGYYCYCMDHINSHVHVP